MNIEESTNNRCRFRNLDKEEEANINHKDKYIRVYKKDKIILQILTIWLDLKL